MEIIFWNFKSEDKEWAHFEYKIDIAIDNKLLSLDSPKLV